MKIDLHVHTSSSKDSLMAPEALVQVVQRRELDGIAIVDHNIIDGAWRVQELAPFKVIVGEEIKTAEGEIIGLFLNETIPSGLSPEETIERIREQGGVVYIPHPFDSLRKSVIKREALMRILATVDALEVLNARVIKKQDNRAAVDLAIERRIAQGAGSDAHHPYEVGRAFVDIPSFETANEFKVSIGQSKVLGRVSSPLVHFTSSYARYKKRLVKR